MTSWPPQHRLLFGATAAVLALLAGVHLTMIRPLAKKVRNDRNYITTTRTALGQSGWPLEPDRLISLREMKRLELEGTGKGGASAREASGLKNKARFLIRESTGMFADRIQRYFEQTPDFVRDISRLDFQDEYNNLAQRLAARNIFLAEGVLRLGEKTTSPHTYQLLLQVWTVDRLAELALAAGLRFRQVEDAVVRDEAGAGRKPAQIRVMPVRAYRVDDGESPYVFEFPVQLGLAGSPEQLYHFLTSLHGEKVFLPLGRIQIAAVPGYRNDQRETALGIAAINVDLECSVFFQTAEDAIERPAQTRPSIRKLPRGA